MAANDNYLHNIAIVGSGGNVGSAILKPLLASSSPKFHVTAITRPGSSSIPADVASSPSVTVATGDYYDCTFLVNTLKGQDALILCLAFAAPSDLHSVFIKAAAEAGIPYLIPNEYGVDTENLDLLSRNPVLKGNNLVRKQIEELGISSWIGISNNPWYDWSFKAGYWSIDVKNKKAVLFDNGETKTYTTTVLTTGLAVAKVLSLPKTAPEGTPSLQSYKNKLIYIRSFQVSQRDMLKAAQRVVGKDGWQIENKVLQEYIQEGIDALAAGNFLGVMNLLYGNAFVDGVGNVYPESVANEVLGLPEEDFDETTRKIVEDILAK